MSKEVYDKLSAEFPSDALSCDSSRGFDLTSVKAQYVKERLNTALGFTNWNWTGEYKPTDKGVLFFGTLKFTIKDAKGVVIEENWTEGVGFSVTKKNDGDTYKSANTDALSKAASNIGVANSVFKGLVDPPASTGGAYKKPAIKPAMGRSPFASRGK